MTPDISVVIPTYNRREFLQKAIASCFDGNESIDVEVVVVDDGSGDGTRRYLETHEDPRVRPVFQEHKGGQQARNCGLREAQGRYIKFLDDDDWLSAGALEDEVAALDRSGADVSYGTYRYVTSDGQILQEVRAPVIDDIISSLLSNQLRTHVLRFCYTRNLVDKLKWDPGLPCRQDVDFVLKVASRDPSYVRVDRTVGCFRQHGGERVSSEARTHLQTEQVHADLLLRAIEDLKNRDLLTSSRRHAAAEGLWMWAHVLAARDLSLFDELYTEICRLTPDFLPDRRMKLLEYLDSIFDPRTTEHLTHPIRRIRYRISSDR